MHAPVTYVTTVQWQTNAEGLRPSPEQVEGERPDDAAAVGPEDGFQEPGPVEPTAVVASPAAPVTAAPEVPPAPAVGEVRAAGDGNPYAEAFEAWADQTQAINEGNGFFQAAYGTNHPSQSDHPGEDRIFATPYLTNDGHLPLSATPQNQAEYEAMTGFGAVALWSAFGNPQDIGGKPGDLWVCWHFTARALELRGDMAASNYLFFVEATRPTIEAHWDEGLDLSIPEEDAEAIFTVRINDNDPPVPDVAVYKHSMVLVYEDPNDFDNSVVAHINGLVSQSGIGFSRVRDVKAHWLGTPPGNNALEINAGPESMLKLPRVLLPSVRR